MPKPRKSPPKPVEPTPAERMAAAGLPDPLAFEDFDRREVSQALRAWCEEWVAREVSAEDLRSVMFEALLRFMVTDLGVVGAVRELMMYSVIAVDHCEALSADAALPLDIATQN